MHFKLLKYGFITITLISGCSDNNPSPGNSSDLPVVTTAEVTNITDVSALSGGEITSDGGQSVTARGVVWSMNPTPTIKDSKTVNGAGGGHFLSQLNDLTPNTSYFIRAYATNSAGTGYGLALSFTTDLITIITSDISSITTSTAIGGGEIQNDQSNSVTKVGLVWSTHETPTIEDFAISQDKASNSFTSTLTGLKPETKYYIRAYGQSPSKIYYGNEKSFTTLINIENEQFAKLTKTWKATSATLDGTDQTGYSNFSLTISGTSGSSSFGYSTAARPPLSPWPSSGTWSFGDNPETQIIRDPGTGDELAVTYSVTDAQLQIIFTFSGTGYPARTANVKGQWVFTFEL